MYRYSQPIYREREELPEIAMAKPHPPPQTSFHESPAYGNSTADGENNGDRCCEIPGRYPHINTAVDFFLLFVLGASS